MARIRPGMAPTASWRHQSLQLFHGTNSDGVEAVIAGIRLERARLRSDFGRGFYTTTLERQAWTWAKELVEAHGRGSPAVVRFDVERDALAELHTLWFVRGHFEAEDYWSFVHHCRTGASGHGKPGLEWYDLVIGPVAAFWRQRLVVADSDQASFHTSRAFQVLDNSRKRVLQ